MREIGQGQALGDAPAEKSFDPRRAARIERLRIGAGAQFVSKPGAEEHELGRFVACIVGPVAEVHPRGLERARHAIDGVADGFSRCMG